MDDLKTIRDTLLTRHAGAAHNLDRLRQEALPRREMTAVEFLCELFRPYALAWVAIATIWLVLVGAQLSHIGAIRHDLPARPSSEAVSAWFGSLKTYEAFAQADRRP